MALILRAGSKERLVHHIGGQLLMVYPLSDAEADRDLLASALPGALERMRSILSNVRSFEPERFDHLNSLQYASLLYLVGNEVWRTAPGVDLIDRLFGLNKMVSGLELFPAIRLPEPFFLSHAIGSVLGNVEYGERLVIFQNVTVGRVGENRPRIGANVVLFAGATVTGCSEIGVGSVVAAGAQVHNLSVPPGSLVTSGATQAQIQPLRRDYLSLYLR